MDPNATWRDLVAAYAANDPEEFSELAEHLRGWLARDGFPPRILGYPALDRVIAQAVCTVSPATLFSKG